MLFSDRIFSPLIVPVFKVFGYRMDGRDKPCLSSIFSTYEVEKRHSGTGFFPPTKWERVEKSSHGLKFSASGLPFAFKGDIEGEKE